MTFPAKLSLKCKLKLMLNTETFYGNSHRSKNVSRVRFDSKLCRESPMCKIWAISVAPSPPQPALKSTPPSSVTSRSQDWKLGRMALQGGPKPKCQGCGKGMFKAGDPCISVKVNIHLSVRTKTAISFRLMPFFVAVSRLTALRSPHKDQIWLRHKRGHFARWFGGYTWRTGRHAKFACCPCLKVNACNKLCFF